MYMASQVMAVASTIILLTYSVMKVKRNTILICNIVINLLLAVHYLLLESYSAAICAAVTAVMVWVFFYKDRFRVMQRKVLNTPLIPLLFAVLFLAAGLLSRQDAWSIIPVLGNILLIVALWNDNENVIKAIFIVVGLLWIVLNIHLKSVANIIGQGLAVLSNVIYFVRIRKTV